MSDEKVQFEKNYRYGLNNQKVLFRIHENSWHLAGAFIFRYNSNTGDEEKLLDIFIWGEKTIYHILHFEAQ